MEAKELHPANEETRENEISSETIEKNEKNEVVNEPAKSEEDTISKDESSVPEEISSAEKETKNSENSSNSEHEPIDFSSMDKSDIIAKLNDIINKYPADKIKDTVNKGVEIFEKKYEEEFNAAKNKFIEEGGSEEDFDFNDNSKDQLKLLKRTYREKKQELNKISEEEKEKNLEEKNNVLEELKELVNRKESLNETFHAFRELQDRWHDIGMIPQGKVKEMWNLYHHHVENFYDYIKINKELRDLDLKKNLEEKERLCKRAEELVDNDSIIEAAQELQMLHDQWREVGPVPKEDKETIWERFKAATEKINKRNYDFFTNLKVEQQNNLKLKTELIGRAEEIAEREYSSHKSWNNATKRLLDIQAEWKTTGAAPKKDRAKIYKHFRAACDKFFDAKREFYLKLKEEQNENLKIKEQLCEKAEALQDSTDWKSTTDKLIALQKEWKTVGPAPRKYSDKIWKRFRAACDKFFNSKSDFFSGVDESQEENLELKRNLLEELKNYEAGGNQQETIEQLKAFQNRWAEIGFVPIRYKNELQDEFRDALNVHFDNLNMSEFDKSIQMYKAKIDSFLHGSNTEKKIIQEREKINNKIKQLETNVITWENNIGFFSDSSTTNKLKDELEEKIDKARVKLELFKEKLKIIDNLL